MRLSHPVLEHLGGSYVFFISIAAVALSITQVAIKLLAKTTCIFQVFCIRGVVICGVMYFVVRLREEMIFGERSKHRLLGFRTLCAALTFVTVHVSTQFLPLVDAAFLVNSYPMTTALLSFALGLETLSWKSWIGVVGCILGNALIVQPPFIFGGDDDEGWDAKRIVGVFIGLLSTLFNSMTTILTKLLGTSVSAYGATFSASLVVFVISVPFMLFSIPKEAIWTPNLGEFGLHVLIVVAGIVFHPSLCRGLQIGPPTKSSILLLTNMLYSALFGVLVLSDDVSWYTLVGALLIIVSVVLISYDKSNSKPHPNSEHSREPEAQLL